MSWQCGPWASNRQIANDINGISADLSRCLARLVADNQTTCSADLGIMNLADFDGFLIPTAPSNLTETLLRGLSSV